MDITKKLQRLAKKYKATVILSESDLNKLPKNNLILFKLVTTDYKSPLYHTQWNKKWELGVSLQVDKINDYPNLLCGKGINLVPLTGVDTARAHIIDDLDLRLLAVLVERNKKQQICVVNGNDQVRVKHCTPISELIEIPRSF